MNIDLEHTEARSQNLTLRSQVAYTEYVYSDWENGVRNSVLSEISSVGAFYNDIDNNTAYKLDAITMDYVTPIFNIFVEDQSYYFNAEEFGGMEYIECAMPHGFGHVNYVAFEIRIKGDEAMNKFIVKGWDPGEGPPPELLPLVNYFESVLIPFLRQHPYPPPE